MYSCKCFKTGGVSVSAGDGMPLGSDLREVALDTAPPRFDFAVFFLAGPEILFLRGPVLDCEMAELLSPDITAEGKSLLYIELNDCARARVVTGDATYSLKAVLKSSFVSISSTSEVLLNFRLIVDSLALHA